MDNMKVNITKQILEKQSTLKSVLVLYSFLLFMLGTFIFYFAFTGDMFVEIIFFAFPVICLIVWYHHIDIRNKQLINLHKEIGDFGIVRTVKGYLDFGKECTLLAISSKGDLFMVECKKTGEVNTELITEKLSYLSNPVFLVAYLER